MTNRLNISWVYFITNLFLCHNNKTLIPIHTTLLSHTVSESLDSPISRKNTRKYTLNSSNWLTHLRAHHQHLERPFAHPPPLLECPLCRKSRRQLTTAHEENALVRPQASRTARGEHSRQIYELSTAISLALRLILSSK